MSEYASRQQNQWGCGGIFQCLAWNQLVRYDMAHLLVPGRLRKSDMWSFGPTCPRGCKAVLSTLFALSLNQTLLVLVITLELSRSLLQPALNFYLLWSSHLIIPWSQTLCITLAYSLSLDTLVHAPHRARGPSVVECRAVAIPESGIKWGRVTVIYLPVD